MIPKYIRDDIEKNIMKAPLHWLKKYVDITISVDELVEKLTAIGHMQDKKPEHIAGDTVLDLEVRQNRSDCYSMWGIAREIGAVTQKACTFDSPSKLPTPTEKSSPMAIENLAPDHCQRFTAYTLQGLDPHAQTPDDIRAALTAYGMPCIHPVVDITNYVMIETGEPLHAFDARAIPGGALRIRQARDQETITVLGNKTLTLTTDDLIITDHADTPVSFSGLIGGSTSGIQSDTTAIVIEAATYNQAMIRRSSIRHGIRTEASTRHEKFLHPHAVEHALARAVDLILTVCGGTITGHAESYPVPLSLLELDIRLTEIARLGGITQSMSEVIACLTRLGFSVLSHDELSARVSVPYWRTDIAYEADIVEEVLRMYGYENITSVIPAAAPPVDITARAFILDEQLRDRLLTFGFSEQITETLTADTASDFGTSSMIEPVRLQNALNAEKTVLRQSLVHGLMQALSVQKKWGYTQRSLFELGLLYGRTTQNGVTTYIERRSLGLLMHDSSKSHQTLYRTLKGIVTALMGSGDHVSHTIVIDAHTVYVSVDLSQHADAPHDTHQKLYTHIPQIKKISVSCYIPRTVKLGDVFDSLSSSFPMVHAFELGEEPMPHGTDQQSVLIHCLLFSDDGMSTTDQHRLLTDIGALLQTRFAAALR